MLSNLKWSFLLACLAAPAACTVASSQAQVIELEDIATDAEAVEVERMALQGDVFSMIRLSRYVGMRNNDVVEARHWLWLAAKHGDCMGISETISYCEDDEELEHCAKWYIAKDEHCPKLPSDASR